MVNKAGVCTRHAHPHLFSPGNPNRKTKDMKGIQMASLVMQTPQTRTLDYHNWIHLNPGDRVIVRRNGSAPEQATVDTVSEDASYFWVWIDGQNRTLIFHGDGSLIQKILP